MLNFLQEYALLDFLSNKNAGFFFFFFEKSQYCTLVRSVFLFFDRQKTIDN